MYLAISRRCAIEPRPAMGSIDHDIRDYLTGKTDGEDLLHALYDDVLDEPIQERLLRILPR